MPPFKDWTTRVLDTASRIVQSEEFQKVSRWAKNKSEQVRQNLKEARRAFAQQMQGMDDQDDLKDLKRTIDRLEERDQAHKN
ncbi:MAG: hypothetical protein JW797_17720 [Bradymonadales bacterium]|nr:hypothetical protein [Bradymonadales bacterium]